MKKNTGTASTTEVRDIVKFQFPATIQTTAKELTAITDQDGNPWFVAKEVCEVLGFDRATDATKYLDADEQTVIRNHSVISQKVVVIFKISWTPSSHCAMRTMYEREINTPNGPS